MDVTLKAKSLKLAYKIVYVSGIVLFLLLGFVDLPTKFPIRNIVIIASMAISFILLFTYSVKMDQLSIKNHTLILHGISIILITVILMLI